MLINGFGLESKFDFKKGSYFENRILKIEQCKINYLNSKYVN